MTAPGRRLAEQWRKEAELLRRRGAAGQADALESCADDLETHVTEWELEELSAADAGQAVGKSASQIRRDVQGGKIPNVAAAGPMKVRRRDLLQLHSPRIS